MNSTPTIGKMIGFSWAKSREILFPFNFKRWLKILVIVWLAGAGIQGFSANFKVPTKQARSSSVPQKIAIPKLPPGMLPQRVEKMSQIPPAVGTLGSSTKQGQALPQKGVRPLSISQDSDRIAKLKAKMEHTKHKTGPVMLAVLVAGISLLGIGLVALMVFFLWLSSRFNFVLLDTLVTQEPVIKKPFKKHEEAGNSYFKWLLAFLGISLGVFLVIGLIGAGLLGIAKGHMALSITLGIFIGFLALVILLGIIIIGILMRDFVLPVMYREKIPAMSALNKFLKAEAFAFGKVFRYLLVILGLWILATIIQSIVGILAVIGGVIAGGMVAIPGVILLKALPLLKLPLIVLGSLVAIALILAIIVVVGMVLLPVVIFFRVFALAYLTRLYPDCDLLGFLGKVP